VLPSVASALVPQHGPTAAGAGASAVAASQQRAFAAAALPAVPVISTFMIASLSRRSSKQGELAG
jgi:hypothetical protein